MEIARADLRYSRGFGRFQAGIDVPFLWMGAGRFDHVVDGFHNTFNMPTGGRNTAPTDRFAYEIRRGSDRFEPDANGEYGLGDVTLEAKTALGGTGALAARALLKLPTGSRSKAFGSGYADASLGLLAGGALGPLRFWGNLDGVFVGGTPDPALHLGTHWIFAAGGTVSASLWSVCDVQLELQYLTSPYSVDLRTWDRDVTMLAFGFARNFGGVRVSLGFTEDLATGASPDFALFLNFGAVPNTNTPRQ